MAGTYDWYVEQGSTNYLRFQFGTPLLDPDTGEYVLDINGYPQIDDPYDWSGCTGAMQVRRRHGDPVLMEFSTADGNIDLQAQGWVLITATPEMTDDMLAIKRAKYDLEITFNGGEVRRLLMGKVLNDLSITQET